MQWSKLRDSEDSNGTFFLAIIHACKETGGTERSWNVDDVKHFCRQTLFGGVPNYAVDHWLSREFMGVKGKEALKEKRLDTVANLLLKHFATLDAGVEHASAEALAQAANIDALLKYKGLGGYDDWTLDDVMPAATWDEVGGKAGLKRCAKRLLSTISAAGRKNSYGMFAPIVAICPDCDELRWEHRGDRCKLVRVDCLCDLRAAGHEFEEDVVAEQAATKAKPPKRARGFSADLDPSGVNITQSFARYCQKLHERYADASPKVVVGKLLGEDVNFPWEGEGSASNAAPESLTGDVGGKVLACFLIKEAEQCPFISKAGGIEPWLQQMVGAPTNGFPAARLCVQKALKWLPQYRACQKSPSGPKLFGESDDSDDGTS